MDRGLNMNLAILIGVSEYQNVGKLNACKNDVKLLKELLEETGKSYDILFLEENTSANNVKTEVINFLSKYSEEKQEIDELFFYYSGHGLVEEDEFHYVLSDYDPKWIKRTTFMNSELDSLIRTVKPKLTIKVVDACFSGSKYIKDINEIEIKKSMELSKECLENCYFMYSSQNNEVSRATNDISLFTQSFINSVLNTDGNQIRYKDIIDYISDEFSQDDKKSQTPYFITQANNTEIFGWISNEAKRNIKGLVDNMEVKIVVSESKLKKDIIDIIGYDALNYCKSIDELNTVFNKMEQHLKENIVFDEKIEALFNIQLECKNISYINIEGIAEVAPVVKDNLSDYFIKLKHEMKMVRVKKHRSLLHDPWNESPDEYVDRERNVLVGYEITEQNIPYSCIEIVFNPKDEYPNLKKYKSNVIFAFSKSRIRILYSRIKYKNRNFDEYSVQSLKWYDLGEDSLIDEVSILSSLDSIKNNIEEFVIEDLYMEFGVERENVEE